MNAKMAYSLAEMNPAWIPIVLVGTIQPVSTLYPAPNDSDYWLTVKQTTALAYMATNGSGGGIGPAGPAGPPGTGSTNITDGVYSVTIPNATISTNLTVTGTLFSTNQTNSGTVASSYYYGNAPAPTSSNSFPQYYFKVGYTNYGASAQTTNFTTNGFIIDVWDRGGTNTGVYSYPISFNLNGGSVFRISKHGNVYVDGGGGNGSSGFYLTKAGSIFSMQGGYITSPSTDGSILYDGLGYAALTLANDARYPHFTGKDGSGSNQAGKPLILAGGRSTGNGVPGYVELSTGLKSYTSATTLRGLTTRYRPGETVTALTESSATTVATIGCNTNTYIGGQFTYTITAKDGTNFQALSGFATFAAVNTNGVHTLTITDPTNNVALAATTGTLTGTWTLVSNSSTNVALKVSAVSSLTQTNLSCKWQLHLNSDDYATVVAY